MDLGPSASTDLGVEPASRSEARDFPGERQAPLSESLFEKCFVEAASRPLCGSRANASSSGHLTNARNFADIERGQKGGLLAAIHPIERR